MIDSPSTRDRDDAIWVQHEGNGDWRVTIAIAAVACAVRKASEEDLQARSRGVTRYGSKGAIEMMLPEIMQRQLSLTDAASRRVVAIEVALSANLEVRDIEVFQATLSDGTVLTYEQAQEIIDAPAEDKQARMLADAAVLAELLLSARRSGGALAIYDLTRGLATNEEGQLVLLGSGERYRSYVIVQELMILANSCIARLAVQSDLQILFRNHTVSVAAPPARDLRADIELALADQTLVNLGTVRERMRLLMRRAEYAPLVAGHYGLNLPAYTHATSPLRRYADLVNQRILLAHIEGSPAPYDRDELVAIGRQLDEIQAEIKHRQSQYFKQQAIKARQDNLSAGAFSTLDSDEFYGMLRHAVRQQNPPAQLSSELGRRFAHGGAGVREAHVLLFTTDPEGWAQDRAAALEYLAEHPEGAPSVLSIELGARNAAQPLYSEQMEGPSHCPRFYATATVVINGQTITGEIRLAGSKKVACQLAALSLICVLAGMSDISSDQPPSVGEVPPASAEADPEAIDALIALHEHCQRQGIAMPAYDFQKSGADHAASFTCTTQLEVASERYTAQASASSKAQAKRQAAKLLHEQLHDAGAYQAGRPAGHADAGGEDDQAALRILHERCQQLGVPIPSYQLSRSGAEHEPSFLCSAELMLAGERHTVQAHGRTKLHARRAAARALYELLVGLERSGA